jgi:mono/diheme cytochrome c family protein
MIACFTQPRSRYALAVTLVLHLTGCGDGAKHRSSGQNQQPADASTDSSMQGAAGEGDQTSMAQPMAGVDAGMQTGDTSAPCQPVKTFESVPPLAAVISGEAAAPDQQPIFTEDLFRQFKTTCGGCHVDNKLGGFQVANKDVFVQATKPSQTLIHDRLHSDDPAKYMPPAGTPGAKPWSEREAGDPIAQLGDLLDRWFAAGSPVDVFYVKSEAAGMSTASLYALSQDAAERLSNLGTCLPAPAIVGTEAAAMDKLDGFFGQLKSFDDLPKTLDRTDLVSLDSETLAQNGVISFAPSYPLFSDNARQMRYVRVAHGQSITFDKTSQDFLIPDNTRFYKTLLKKVIDQDGNERYRKMETQLIVSRPDGPDDEDGDHETNALFATYAWNQNETQATLVEDPLRDQTPFRDRLVNYVVDEAKAQQVLTTTQALNKLEALRAAGATRNYAIPGRARCLDCHMGSHSHSFVLGFAPLQIKRRPMGMSGVIEQTADDELSQLQRLIDYKVITGIDSVDDVLPLEAAEGDRSPRNQYELTAQAYMMGNCAHCHNDRGDPTVESPVLHDVLNFYPDKTGGIFQFPIERTTPRIKRGKLQNVQIPYITPSLIDFEPDASEWDGANYQAKYVVSGEASGRWVYYMDAPWRSLIYRTVDTPYIYVEDYALYPHMPFNTPGFDCRAPKILADWMISIPARLRSPSTPQGSNAPVAANSSLVEEQPYVEVKPADDGYEQAVSDAKQRLNFYHNGGRDSLVGFKANAAAGAVGLTHVNYRYSQYCADTSDIVDSDVGTNLIPSDSDPSPSWLPSLPKPPHPNPQDPLDLFTVSGDGIPNRPHWVVTDDSDPPGPWNPRRIDWQDVLVKHQLSGADDHQQRVVSMLQSLVITDEFKRFATTPQPFGLWQRKAGCDFSSVPVASSFTGSSRPQWMDYRAKKVASSQANVKVALKDDDPVYEQSPGATVFAEICVNCHGAENDAGGRQADNIITMTGGDTRVANLRDGLLGPIDEPGANSKRVFSAGPNSATYADWTARYVVWMGLGGTQRAVPTAILNLIGTAQVLGEPRPSDYSAAAESANMLSIAQQLCRQVLGESANVRNVHANFDPTIGAIIHAASKNPGTALIEQNGDAETWLQICSHDNQPPVRIISPQHNYELFNIESWRSAANYPTSSAVGDERSNLVTGIAPANLFPWCVRPPATADEQTAADDYARTFRAGKALPFCPSDWLKSAATWTDVDVERWSLQGAINAGVSVYLYMKQRSEDEAKGVTTQPSYDHCDQHTH